MLPRRLKTDGSKTNRFACLFHQAKWKKRCAIQLLPQSQFFNGLEKPPTNLKGQIAERNKTRINAFFVNCYLSHSPGSACHFHQLTCTRSVGTGGKASKALHSQAKLAEPGGQECCSKLRCPRNICFFINKSCRRTSTLLAQLSSPPPEP